MKEELTRIVLNTTTSLFAEFGMRHDHLNEHTPLYGTRDGISSLALVRLIVDLEEAVEIELGKTVTIADEKVLSMQHSPFATVGTLLIYMEALIK
jgi:acyl carrier protein